LILPSPTGRERNIAGKQMRKTDKSYLLTGRKEEGYGSI
jgi:hypothetical protein